MYLLYQQFYPKTSKRGKTGTLRLIHDRLFTRQFKGDISDKYILSGRGNFNDNSDSYYGYLINSLDQHTRR